MKTCIIIYIGGIFERIPVNNDDYENIFSEILKNKSNIFRMLIEDERHFYAWYYSEHAVNLIFRDTGLQRKVGTTIKTELKQIYKDKNGVWRKAQGAA